MNFIERKKTVTIFIWKHQQSGVRFFVSKKFILDIINNCIGYILFVPYIYEDQIPANINSRKDSLAIP